jgi:plasmid stabilization system protein ParE
VTVYFASQAEADFAEVVRFLAERSQASASALGQRVFAIIDRLAAGDLDGPEQTLRSGEVVRSWPVPPLRLYY